MNASHCALGSACQRASMLDSSAAQALLLIEFGHIVVCLPLPLTPFWPSSKLIGDTINVGGAFSNPENGHRCDILSFTLKSLQYIFYFPRKCLWTIVVPKGKHILLVFNRFNLEWDHSCDLDYLVIYSALGRLIGKFCGDVRPRPLLIHDTSITLKFISDFQEYNTGFSLSYQAVEPNLYPDSDCGSVAIIFEEGKIQSMNHPQAYDSLAHCQWVVHSPVNHVIMVISAIKGILRVTYSNCTYFTTTNKSRGEQMNSLENGSNIFRCLLIAIMNSRHILVDLISHEC